MVPTLLLTLANLHFGVRMAGRHFLIGCLQASLPYSRFVYILGDGGRNISVLICEPCL